MYKIFACLILVFCLIGCGVCVVQEVDLNLVSTPKGCERRYDIYTRIWDMSFSSSNILYSSSKYNVVEDKLESVKSEEYRKAEELLDCFNNQLGGE